MRRSAVLRIGFGWFKTALLFFTAISGLAPPVSLFSDLRRLNELQVGMEADVVVTFGSRDGVLSRFGQRKVVVFVAFATLANIAVFAVEGVLPTSPKRRSLPSPPLTNRCRRRRKRCRRRARWCHKAVAAFIADEDVVAVVVGCAEDVGRTGQNEFFMFSRVGEYCP